jgi:molecular chaperone GrpE
VTLTLLLYIYVLQSLREVKLVTNEKNILQDEKKEVLDETSNVVDEQSEEQSFNTSEEIHNEDIVDEDELTLAQKQIAALQSELEERDSRILRLQADFDNYRRRVRLDQEATVKYRAQSLVSDILPALDNFERALKVESDDDKVKSLLQGMEMVYRQLVEAVKKEGVEPIDAVGQVFDPHLHQAVMQVEDSNFESNSVVEEFQKGYKLHDRIIRPSMVKVNQ